MSNALDVFMKAKTGYLSTRGGTPDPSSPSKMIPKTTYGDVIAFGRTLEKFVSSGDFVQTDSYVRAYRAFDSTIPMAAAADFVARTPTLANMIYPKNVEFWTKGLTLAIARGGAGDVPTSLSIAMESAKESWDELPDNLSKFFHKIPGVDTFTTALKWMAVAAIGFGIWAVFGPEIKKRLEKP
jgi:hypothetical protein